MNNWDKTFVESLSLYEQHSKCSAKQVACILVKDNNILSIGINGTLSGKTNCNEKFIKDSGKWYKKENNSWKECNNNEHSEWSKLNEVHAEMNAIKKATQGNGFNLEGATAYITYSPCFNCAKMLVLFGIKKIIFKNPYDDINEVLEFLEDNDIEVIYWNKNVKDLSIKDSGYVIRIDHNGYIFEVENGDGKYLYKNPLCNFNTINEEELAKFLEKELKDKKLTLIEYSNENIYRHEDFVFYKLFYEELFDPTFIRRGRIKFFKNEKDIDLYSKGIREMY